MKNMKLALATAAIAASITVFAAENAADDKATEGQGIGAIGWTPVQIGLFAPVSIPWGFDWDVKGFDLNLFYIETSSSRASASRASLRAPATTRTVFSSPVSATGTTPTSAASVSRSARISASAMSTASTLRRSACATS